MTTNGWGQEDGIVVARLCEVHATPNGLHVGMTGGVLYKDGMRKDLDIVVYTHGESPVPDAKEIDARKARFLGAIGATGFAVVRDYGRVVKATHGERSVDFLFPQISGDYPEAPRE